MLKMYYLYTNYKDFPEATRISERNSRTLTGFSLLIGVGTLFVVTLLIGAFVENTWLGVAVTVCFVLLCVFGIRFLIKQYYRSEEKRIIQAVFSNRDISIDQINSLVCYYSAEDRFSTGLKVAKLLKDNEEQYRNGFISNTQFISKRDKILNYEMAIISSYNEAHLTKSQERLKSQSNAHSIQQVTHEYCFENAYELNRYQCLNPTIIVHWIKSGEYTSLYDSGIVLYEKENYQQAIEQFERAIAINPVGIRARVAIIDCLIELDYFEKAREELLLLQDYLSDKGTTCLTYIADYYIDYGIALLHDKDYDGAYACCKYSKEFEDVGYADELIASICHCAQQEYYNQEIDVVGVIQERRIHVFKTS